jgi:uncharacterized protein YbjT (DUF2867 family)
MAERSEVGWGMRVLVVGVTGLIGSAIAARISALGHSVVGVSRHEPWPALTPIEHVYIDVARATDASDWLPHLHGVDAVVNCAGVLQDSPRDSTEGVHVRGAAALFAACARAPVGRVIHVSAVGIDREAPTRFSRSKLDGELALMALALDWIILRPSVVIGRNAYGGSALVRALAALPIRPIVPDTGELQVVHLDDLVDTVVFFLAPNAPSRQVIELVGPRRWSFDELVELWRKWLGYAPARVFKLPRFAAQTTFRLGDVAGLLGWRPPIRSTAQKEIVRGAVGDARAWESVTGIKPRDIERALAAEPPGVQERWFARLYLLKALIFAVLSLFWIGTGVIALGPGFQIGTELMREGGAGQLAGPSVIAGALADIAIGIGIAVRPYARVALYAALAISLFYAAAGTLLVPRLWNDPLGPMLKIWPIIALNLTALAILNDR